MQLQTCRALFQMCCQPFVVCSSETRCRPLFLSVYLFPVPCHPCLASCHMVRAEMSSLMIHTYVRAPVSIPVPALVRTSRCIDTVRWSPYAIMPCPTPIVCRCRCCRHCGEIGLERCGICPISRCFITPLAPPHSMSVFDASSS